MRIAVETPLALYEGGLENWGRVMPGDCGLGSELPKSVPDHHLASRDVPGYRLVGARQNNSGSSKRRSSHRGLIASSVARPDSRRFVGTYCISALS